MVEDGGTGSSDAPTATQRDARERRRARRVTWSAVGVLLLVAAVQLELWPLTAYRLFSEVRTGTSSSIDLVAVAADGTRTPVRLDPRNPVVVTTGRQYAHVRTAEPARQREMVRAWLGAAGIDPGEVAEVRLEQVVLQMDPDTRERQETDRRLLVEVSP